jgi:Hemerythrin HHE cation binding domain
MGMTAEQRRNLAGLYSQTRDELLALCTVLEQIADSLPDKFDQQVCMHAARALVPLMDRAHRLEEEVLFPALTQSGSVLIDLKAMVEQLKFDHLGDEFFAEELAETLASYGAGAPLHDAEATGYMLRGFFVNIRRHTALEHELFAPVLGLEGRSGQMLDG